MMLPPCRLLDILVIIPANKAVSGDVSTSTILISALFGISIRNDSSAIAAFNLSANVAPAYPDTSVDDFGRIVHTGTRALALVPSLFDSQERFA